MSLSQQSSASVQDIPLHDFVSDDDRIIFTGESTRSSLRALSDLVNIQIVNSFTTLQGLHAHLDDVDLLHPEHLRPSWDAYFMVGFQLNNILLSVFLMGDRRHWLHLHHVVQIA